MHNEFNRLTSGLIHIAHRDSRVSLIERDDDAVKVYFENRFVAVVREAEKHIELIAGNEGRDINVTRAEAGIATLIDVMREMAA